jgi:hypothetical protein
MFLKRWELEGMWCGGLGGSVKAAQCHKLVVVEARQRHKYAGALAAAEHAGHVASIFLGVGHADRANRHGGGAGLHGERGDGHVGRWR